MVKVIIIYKNIIIFVNQINLNYYHIQFKYNNENITIIGNHTYIIENLKLHQFIDTNNKKVAGFIRIIFLPIHQYPQEDCCICYENQGILVGVCGHKNICKECLDKITLCPSCNTVITCNNLHLFITK